MWKHIFCQGFYQLFWLFLIVYGTTKYIGPYKVCTESQLPSGTHCMCCASVRSRYFFSEHVQVEEGLMMRQELVETMNLIMFTGLSQMRSQPMQCGDEGEA
jgi:hypothetical protein